VALPGHASRAELDDLSRGIDLGPSLDGFVDEGEGLEVGLDDVGEAGEEVGAADRGGSREALWWSEREREREKGE